MNIINAKINHYCHYNNLFHSNLAFLEDVWPALRLLFFHFNHNWPSMAYIHSGGEGNCIKSIQIDSWKSLINFVIVLREK